jgi:hypothetical protein
VRISKSSKASYLRKDGEIIWSRSRRSQGTLSQPNEELLVPRTEIITSTAFRLSRQPFRGCSTGI